MRFLVALLLVAAPAVAQTTTEYREAVGPTLIGGVPANPADWPASVYARMGGAACSATVVGERVLLIASHCVSNGGTARFQVGANAYSAVCSHAPGYPSNSTYDWTLCLVDRPVTGAPYEWLAEDGSDLAVGQGLRLTGYGCVRSGGGGGNDGVFRIGKAPIISLPSTGGTNADIVSRGTSALCYGDSGGAAYHEDADGSRYIVGVNSRGNISTTSYLSAVYHSRFRTFMQTWSTAKGVKICGFHVDAVGCRVQGSEPDPDPDTCMDELDAYEESLGLAAVKFETLKECLVSP